LRDINVSPPAADPASDPDPATAPADPDALSDPAAAEPVAADPESDPTAVPEPAAAVPDPVSVPAGLSFLHPPASGATSARAKSHREAFIIVLPKMTPS
jgi:hypothetical protein